MTVWMSLTLIQEKKTTLKTIILKIKLKSNIENVANKNNLNILEITFFFLLT